jgi:hypothetical protein
MFFTSDAYRRTVPSVCDSSLSASGGFLVESSDSAPNPADFVLVTDLADHPAVSAERQFCAPVQVARPISLTIRP